MVHFPWLRIPARFVACADLFMTSCALFFAIFGVLDRHADSLLPFRTANAIFDTIQDCVIVGFWIIQGIVTVVVLSQLWNARRVRKPIGQRQNNNPLWMTRIWIAITTAIVVAIIICSATTGCKNCKSLGVLIAIRGVFLLIGYCCLKDAGEPSENIAINSIST